MTTTTETTTWTTGVKRGFPGLACIKCGEKDAVRVQLEDITFVCSSCDEEFTAEDVCDLLAGWSRVMDWVQAAPSR